MTLQVGLGLPAFAMLHLVGHGFYKAWLFLRAGGASRRPAVPRNSAGIPAWALLALPAATALVVALGCHVARMAGGGPGAATGGGSRCGDLRPGSPAVA